MDRGKKKEAVKKVIAAMTVGKDVSPLFPGELGRGCWVLVGACCLLGTGRGMLAAWDSREG